MIRRPPRSTLSSSSAASDVYKRQTVTNTVDDWETHSDKWNIFITSDVFTVSISNQQVNRVFFDPLVHQEHICLWSVFVFSFRNTFGKNFRHTFFESFSRSS